MILKSFYRLLSVKIYFVILLTLFIIISIFNIFINYLTLLNDKSFQNISLFYVESLKDYKLLLENNNIENVKPCLTFNYVNGVFANYILENFDLNNKVLVYYDNTLDYREVIIELNNSSYISYEKYIFKLINSDITFKYQENEYTFQIKDIKASTNTKIFISKDIFDTLYNNYTYTGNMQIEKLEDETYQYLYDVIDGKVLDLSSETYKEYENRMQIQEYINYLGIVSYILLIIFIIIIIVVNKNIIADLEKNIKLEYYLGFRKKSIRNNIFKRLLSLHFFSFLISLLIILPIMIGFNINNNHVFIIFGFIAIGDFILSRIIKLKIK